MSWPVGRGAGWRRWGARAMASAAARCAGSQTRGDPGGARLWVTTTSPRWRISRMPASTGRRTSTVVPTGPGKGPQELDLSGEAVPRGLLGDPMGPGVHVEVQPAPGSGVELGDRAGRIERHLLHEGGVELAEGPLGLALALGISCLAGLQREAVVGGEVEGFGEEAVGAAARDAERPHAVGPPDGCHPTNGLEEPHQALEGVRPVVGGGEPPVPAA